MTEREGAPPPLLGLPVVPPPRVCMRRSGTEALIYRESTNEIEKRVSPFARRLFFGSIASIELDRGITHHNPRTKTTEQWDL